MFHKFCVLFWNVRGLNRLSKRYMVKQIVLDNRCSLFFLSETKLNACCRRIVRQLSGFHSSNNYQVINANGLSGGLLAVWDSSIWSCTNCIIREWSIQLFLKHHLSNFAFIAVGVYGPPSRIHRVAFFQELRQFFSNNHEPILAAGDFNITLHNGERLNCVGNAADSRRFSKLIADTGLLDFPISKNLYYWTNKQRPSTLAKLDRILINNNLASSFPLSVASSGNRRLSDHNPLMWHSSSQSEAIRRPFRIEVGWLKCDQFSHIIHAGLVPPHSASSSASPLCRWLSLWKPLRRTILEWDKFRRVSWSKLRVETESRISSLNVLANSDSINEAKFEELKSLKGVLHKCYNDTCTYWGQRAKKRWLKDGDRNTRYFISVLPSAE
ncbi:ribonuclease H protein [Canna indica]|uniref:Ribonuclease H protein n=1 Tax=Canna indica TaxID=4628 RepID=A0AAQ3QPM9_9LILI|nr:ribonuclease H protein [Canna indica]